MHFLNSAKAMALVSFAFVGMTALTGCTSVVTLTPADDAQNPLCAEVSVRLPDVLDDFDKRETNAQATGAWGNPAQVLLRCGVTSPGPTTDECREFEGVDWIIDDSGNTYVIATTYGREPAVEVVMDRDLPAPGVILSELADTVAPLPSTSNCI